LSRTTTVEFRETLRGILITPAIGVELPFDDVTLEGLPIWIDPMPEQLRSAVMGITAGELGIANYGTVVVTSGDKGTEQVSLYANTHVIVLDESDIVDDMSAAFEQLQAQFADGLTSAVLSTGPSATADMGELVYGAHGPRNVHVLLLTDA
jgi:L-lactate dehydrogenase complex protein LldG